MNVQNTSEKFAAVDEAVAAAEEPVETPDLPEKNTVDVVKKYISDYFPNLTEEEVVMVADVFKQMTERRF